jgi:general secretion pathway protein E
VLERGRGCAKCRETGYHGRTGLFELLVLSEEARQAFSRVEDVPRLREMAREQGMVTLREDGWRKVQAGLTTVEEVLRVVQE